MPIFQIDSLINGLIGTGVRCRRGILDTDVDKTLQPYYERWLSNRDGFVKIDDSNIDYIGVEEVMRMGPFFDIFCLLKNPSIIESDENAHELVSCYPQFMFRSGKIVSLGWTGGLLSHYLAGDDAISASIARIPPGEEFAKLFVRPADFCCIIQTQVWEPLGIVSIYPLINQIGMNIKNLLKLVHLGETTEI
ncbi:MAG: hypothetical protein WBX01_01150 [Nitrososphaeraceae archaeon]|jgi:hypothetical protein